jgi:anti-sigma factor RsiW
MIQLTLEPGIAARSDLGDAHLTEEQFGELIAASARTSPAETPLTEAHLLSCEQCAAELASLRECLSLFREASTAYANNELRRMPQVSLPARRLLLFPALTPAYLALAAAAIFLAALLPMQVLRQRAPQPVPAVAARVADAPSESDEALLEDVNSEASASVPAPMQALADPTAGASSTSTGTETPVQNSDQRKD